MMSKTDLFTIGEFPAITGVGIHSLRYYDEIGALKPEYVDPVSNYRYYGFRQLGRIPAINLCKDAGINLSNFDSFLVNGAVDYQRLVDESRKSLESKINGYRLKQRELEQVEAVLAIEQKLRTADEVKIHLDSIRVRLIPLNDRFRSADSSAIIRKISSEAHRQGQHLTTSFCGLMQTGQSSPSVNAFMQTFESSENQSDNEHISVIPSGEYLIRRTDAIDLATAEKYLSKGAEASYSDIIISFAFLRDAPEPLYCAAALIA